MAGARVEENVAAALNACAMFPDMGLETIFSACRGQAESGFIVGANRKQKWSGVTSREPGPPAVNRTPMAFARLLARLRPAASFPMPMEI